MQIKEWGEREVQVDSSLGKRRRRMWRNRNIDADVIGRVPRGRFASANDIANAIAFLDDAQEIGFLNEHASGMDGEPVWDGCARAGSNSKLGRLKAPS
jgi:hypothetical protein